ncbi:MAG TPA: hypothetical protein ENI31_05555 [Candidatus Omnitrophica bacterium]|nr:MAG: hypothetical protein DRP61_04400 [Candidatus Omnitrophota bacterium]RKY35036.1 MAG: hypothetical protein DRP69_02835 [Candidatus Omnitrophota bacterium]RKY43619.1 MAG: hypothetical protein DRP80_04735 [Candidatus Omnitrophota bacterium]HEC69726.1 hypothetical protein [Candidatus Omnitrophota bacterium]
MFKRFSIIIGCILLLGIGGVWVYFQIKLENLREEKSKLLSKVASADEEISELRSSLKDKEAELIKIRKELESLSYPQRLKKALSASQEMINQLSAEINSLKEEVNSLREEKISWQNRANINAKEVRRLLGELQEAKKKIAQLESSQVLSQPSSISLSERSEREGQKIKDLRIKFAELKKDYRDLLKERNFLRKNIERYQKELSQKKPSKHWQERIEELKDLLKERERERRDLEKKLSELKRGKEGLSKKLEEQSKEIKELSLLNENLQKQIVNLTSQLSEKSKEYYALQNKLTQPKIDENDLAELQERIKIQRERLKTVSYLYNRLKDQLKQLSDILYTKDSELEKKDKEIARLKDEISYLKIKAENLEEAFKASEENQKKILDRLKQVSSLNNTLQEKLGEVSGLLGEELSSKKVSLEGESSKSLTSPEENLNELRKKVEVILRSIQSPDSSGEDSE